MNRVKLKEQKIFQILTVVFLIFLISSPSIFGQERTESAGNVFYTGTDESITGKIDRDVYSAGRIINVDNSTIGRSILIGAQNINVKNSTIGDSFRSASRTLNISQTKIDNNITVAAQSIYIDDGTTANAIYGCSQDMEFNGTANFLEFFGETITITGNIKGNAEVSAANVIVKSGAVIEGSLKVSSQNQPDIEDGAKVGNLNVDIEESQESSPTETLMGNLISIGYWIVATVIIGLLMIMFINPAINQASEIVRDHPISFFVSGFLGLILIPIILILLFIPFVTIPSSVVFLVIYGICLGVSVPFTALVLGRMVLPNLNKWLSGLIFLVVLALLSRIKFVGWLVLLLCSIFILGYVILALYSNMKNSFHNRQTPKEF